MGELDDMAGLLLPRAVQMREDLSDLRRTNEELRIRLRKAESDLALMTDLYETASKRLSAVMEALK